MVQWTHQLTCASIQGPLLANLAAQPATTQVRRAAVFAHAQGFCTLISIRSSISASQNISSNGKINWHSIHETNNSWQKVALIKVSKFLAKKILYHTNPHQKKWIAWFLPSSKDRGLGRWLRYLGNSGTASNGCTGRWEMIVCWIFHDFSRWSLIEVFKSWLVMIRSKLLHIVKYQHANSHDALLKELWLGTTLPWRDYIEHSCCTLRYAMHFFGLVFCSSLQLPLIFAYNQPMFHNPNPSAKSASTEILLVVTGGLSVTTAFEGWNVEVKKLGNTSTSPKLNHARKPAKFNCIALKAVYQSQNFQVVFLGKNMISKPCLELAPPACRPLLVEQEQPHQNKWHSYTQNDNCSLFPWRFACMILHPVPRCWFPMRLRFAKDETAG